MPPHDNPAIPRRPWAGPSRPVRLRSVDADIAQLRTLVGVGRRAELAVGTVRLQVEASSARLADALPLQRPLYFETPAGRIALAPSRETVRMLTAIDLPLDHDDAQPLQRLGLEIAMQAMPAGWFELFDASAFLVDEDGAPGPIEMTLTLVQPDVHIGLATTLRGTAEALRRAVTQPGWRPMRSSPLPPDWTLEVPVCAGHTTLPVETLRALAVGDLVVVERPCFDLDGCGKVPIGRRTANCWLRIGNQVELEFTEWHATTTDPTMHTTASSTDSLAHDGDDALDGVPVVLAFELGQLELPLAELEALAPGAVLTLAGPLPPELIIRAGGRRIGTGELVELDGRLGVEIRRLGEST